MTAGADAPSNDCVGWLEGWVTLKLGTKADKFRRLLANEDAARPIHNFLENPECLRLVVVNRDKDVSCADLPPSVLKHKAVCFIKIDRATLHPNIIDACVTVMDLLPDTLLQLYRTCQESYLPLLSNPENQQGWPDVIVQDVLDQFQRLTASVYVSMGQLRGKTMLPLPSMDASPPDKTAREKECVHAFETAVVTWTRQIKNVLKAEPEGVLKAGGHPGPLHELDFWNHRRDNLRTIEQQLASDKIGKVSRQTVCTVALASWTASAACGGVHAHAVCVCSLRPP